MENKLKLPLKLPVEQRKKLSLLFDDVTQQLPNINRMSLSSDYGSPKEPFYYKTNNSKSNEELQEEFDSGIANDTYSALINKSDLNTLNARDSNSEDNYLRLSELSCYVYSNRSSDNSITYQSQLLSDESDDDSDHYYIPVGLTNQSQNLDEYYTLSKTEETQNDDVIEDKKAENEYEPQYFMFRNNAPNLPRKISKKEFQKSIKMKYSDKITSNFKPLESFESSENEYYIAPICNNKKHTIGMSFVLHFLSHIYNFNFKAG